MFGRLISFIVTRWQPGRHWLQSVTFFKLNPHHMFNNNNNSNTSSSHIMTKKTLFSKSSYVQQKLTLPIKIINRKEEREKKMPNVIAPPSCKVLKSFGVKINSPNEVS